MAFMNETRLSWTSLFILWQLVEAFQYPQGVLDCTCKPEVAPLQIPISPCTVLEEDPLQYVHGTLCILCQSKPSPGSLLRFSKKQCAFSCCGEKDNEYCCVASNSVLIGCSVAGGSLVIVIVGAACYLVRRVKKKRRSRHGVRPRPRSVSQISMGCPPVDRFNTLFAQLEVRRFSQLSQVSMPSRIYRANEELRGKIHNIHIQPRQSHHMDQHTMNVFPS